MRAREAELSMAAPGAPSSAQKHTTWVGPCISLIESYRSLQRSFFPGKILRRNRELHAVFASHRTSCAEKSTPGTSMGIRSALSCSLALVSYPSIVCGVIHLPNRMGPIALVSNGEISSHGFAVCVIDVLFVHCPDRSLLLGSELNHGLNSNSERHQWRHMVSLCSIHTCAEFTSGKQAQCQARNLAAWYKFG
jgi:hypothetical protein